MNVVILRKWLSDKWSYRYLFYTLYHTQPFYGNMLGFAVVILQSIVRTEWEQKLFCKSPNGSILNCTISIQLLICLSVFCTIHVLLHFCYGQCWNRRWHSILLLQNDLTILCCFVHAVLDHYYGTDRK